MIVILRLCSPGIGNNCESIACNIYFTSSYNVSDLINCSLLSSFKYFPYTYASNSYHKRSQEMIELKVTYFWTLTDKIHKEVNFVLIRQGSHEGAQPEEVPKESSLPFTPVSQNKVERTRWLNSARYCQYFVNVP